MSPTIAEWREVYPSGPLDDRVLMAFVSAGVEPPTQDHIDQFGFGIRDAAILAPLIRTATEQEQGA